MPESVLDSQRVNCESVDGRKDKQCETASRATRASGPEDILEILDKIEKLAGSVNILQHKFAMHSKKLDRLQTSSNEDSDRDPPQLKQTNLDSSKKKSRNSKVEEEGRQCKVLQDKSSRRKSSKKSKCNLNRSSASKLERDMFSEDSSNSSFSSECDQHDMGRNIGRCRRIKSGAKVKKRPVVRTELWPHTISNEEDGDEVDSENMGLARFFSCFTYIMLSCGREVESQGRASLLHAVSKVFEYLPWAEARTFHNLMMVKIEQDRINWWSDFTVLADEYVDKKVRLSLRAKSASAQSADTNYYYKTVDQRGPGKVRGGSNYNYQDKSGNNKFLQNVICWQWNNSSCSFGDKCKRWHACRTCAEAGKLGEPHKASSHENSSLKAKPGEPRG